MSSDHINFLRSLADDFDAEAVASDALGVTAGSDGRVWGVNSTALRERSTTLRQIARILDDAVAELRERAARGERIPLTQLAIDHVFMPVQINVRHGFTGLQNMEVERVLAPVDESTAAGLDIE